jgi:hypothetical protein
MSLEDCNLIAIQNSLMLLNFRFEKLICLFLTQAFGNLEAWLFQASFLRVGNGFIEFRFPEAMNTVDYK